MELKQLETRKVIDFRKMAFKGWTRGMLASCCKCPQSEYGQTAIHIHRAGRKNDEVACAFILRRDPIVHGP